MRTILAYLRQRILRVALPVCLIVMSAAGQSSLAAPSMSPVEDWSAQWIGVIGGNKPNTWICFRKKFDLAEDPKQAVAKIACDSKYWLWVNDELVVFEGQLKRGPTPQDTYFDSVDLSPYLRQGENTVAVLVWYFGCHGFSHNSSGKAALLFDANIDGLPLISDDTWKARVHPAFGTTDPPKDNVRQPEANIRYDARHDLENWQLTDYDDSGWGPPTLFGSPPTGPWNNLYERPIPQWKNSGIVDYEGIEESTAGQQTKHMCKLPYNCHVTPFLKVDAPAGKVIGIRSDIFDLYGKLRLVETHRHEYVTREGVQEFELPCWINGHEIHYLVPDGIEVLSLKYRETGYDTDLLGSFECDDPELNQLWQESLRTLYVTMRDTYMDCPDRERAQWWGDAVNEIGEAFYALDPEKAPLLAKKGIYELVRWQREDGTLYSPVPAGLSTPGIESPMDGSWDKELPQQMLASVGWYGFWNYYWYSGDAETIQAVYPAVKNYLDLWKLGADGLVFHRPGEWDWTDWGSNIDVPVVENAWLYLALKGAVAMAELTGNQGDIPGYRAKMKNVQDHYRAAFWQGNEYRSADYQGETDDRANAMAVVAGLARPEDYPAISQVLAQQNHASPYMEKYVLEALLLMGQPELARQRMKQRYAEMLGDSYTTLWEMFETIELEGFGSLGKGTCNHAWSGGPLTILSQYVAGIAPTKPGFETYQILPQLGELKHVEAVVPTQHGEIRLQVERDGSLPFQLVLESPAGTDAVVGLPQGEVPADALIRINDTIVSRAGIAVEHRLPVERAEGDDRYVRFRVPAGRWQFVVETADKADANTLTEEEQAAGFELLFNGKDLEHWQHAGNWIVVDGAIHRADDGGFLTYGKTTIPDDFELRFQWKVGQGANSGVYYRPSQYEYQILDNKLHSDGKNPRTSAAALYFCMAPTRDVTRSAGQWNDGKIICKGTVIQHWLNGVKVVGFDYADPKWSEHVERLRQLGGELELRGAPLNLQDHGDPVWYRAIKLRELGPTDVLDRSPVIPSDVPASALESERKTLEHVRRMREKAAQESAAKSE